MTAIWTLEGWLYLSTMLDLFSRRVVAWAVSPSNDTLLALETLQAGVVARRPPAGLVHHSDRGSPYASADYRGALSRHRIVASMSRKGDCWDNAVAESFFATLRAELVEHERYATHQAATDSIGDYIENFYNVTVQPVPLLMAEGVPAEDGRRVTDSERLGAGSGGFPRQRDEATGFLPEPGRRGVDVAVLAA